MTTAGALAVGLPVGMFLLYDYLLFAWVYDCKPDYRSIDACLDFGGAWNYEARLCEQAPTPLPTALPFPRLRDSN